MSSGQEAWERIGTELMATDPSIDWSTMMGLPCLRVDGAFFASLDKRSGDLVVKLPADEVGARIERGAGKPFAPAGKVFREWLAIEAGDVAAWRAAMADALSFVRGS
jgi:hypothetical protein